MSHVDNVGIAWPGALGGQQVNFYLTQVIPVGDTQLGFDIWVRKAPRV